MLWGKTIRSYAHAWGRCPCVASTFVLNMGAHANRAVLLKGDTCLKDNCENVGCCMHIQLFKVYGEL